MPSPLRVLLVSEPGVDGVFRHVDGFVRYLVEEGHEVHLAYSDHRNCPALYQLVEFVQARGGRTLNLAVGNAPCWGDISAFYRLWSLAREIKPQVVHAHSSKAGVLGRALRFVGISASYFYTPHAYYGLSFRPKASTAFYNAIERFFARIGTTINVSEDERSFAIKTLKVPATRCLTIDNPVDPTLFRPASVEEKLEQRRKLKLPEHAVLLGCMARVSFQKDPTTLYQAFAQARARNLDLYLVHAGRGEAQEMAKLQDLATSLGLGERLIRFEYFRDPREFYSSIDGLILTSRYEGCWCYTLLEALACDLPLISGTGPGTSDLPSAGLSHCWTAGVGDVDGFSSAMGAWFADRKVGRPSNHRVVALKRFSPDICFGAVVNRYRMAL